jgi:hypothetical protein
MLANLHLHGKQSKGLSDATIASNGTILNDVRNMSFTMRKNLIVALLRVSRILSMSTKD